MNDFLDFMISKVKPKEIPERVVFIAGFRGWSVFVDGEEVAKSDGFPYDSSDSERLNFEDFKNGLALVKEYEAKFSTKH